jgi:peptidoglycan/xylan/chitin deacetylase (PgdA/CDA1 family)
VPPRRTPDRSRSPSTTCRSSVPFYTSAQGEDVTTRLLAGLKAHHLRAIGFVNEIQLDNNYRVSCVALLKQWLDAGMDLGNHSYSHLSLTHTPVDAYIANVARGEAVTKALLAARGRPAANVARLYAAFAEGVRGHASVPTTPDFDHAARLHRSLHAIETAATCDLVQPSLSTGAGA